MTGKCLCSALPLCVVLGGVGHSTGTPAVTDYPPARRCSHPAHLQGHLVEELGAGTSIAGKAMSTATLLQGGPYHAGTDF